MSGETEDYEYMYSKRICTTTMKEIATRKKVGVGMAQYDCLVVMERTTCMSGYHDLLFCGGKLSSRPRIGPRPNRPVPCLSVVVVLCNIAILGTSTLARVRLNDDAVAADPVVTFSVRR